MVTLNRRSTLSISISALILAVLTTSCTPMRQPPEEIASSQPTVTYKYQNDADLYQADQKAVTYCNQYGLIPNPINFSTEPDGSKVVAYTCAPRPAPVTATRPNADLSYTYNNDQELLSASRNAQIYCMNNGMRQVSSSTVLNPNGTKTISFQCGPV